MTIDLNGFLKPEIIALYAEVNQSRSAFQLEKFVLGQHDMEEMRYYQCLLEIQSLYFSLKTSNLKIKQTEIKIERLKKSADEIDIIEAEIMEVGLEQTNLVVLGAVRELGILCDMLKTFPTYTRKQVDDAQPEYWRRRLTRQSDLAMATTSANQAAHLDSLIQIGELSFKMSEELTELERKEIEGVK